MNSQSIKIFSDSIAKGINVRPINQSIKTGHARIQSFPGATSKQLLHYLDVNLESTTNTVILHIGISDLLQDISIDNFNNFMKNIELMIQKYRGFGGFYLVLYIQKGLHGKFSTMYMKGWLVYVIG